MSSPLADRIRPTNIEDMVGQKHLLGKDKALRNIIDSQTIPNMIFYGPSGVGKTTLARIIASKTNKKLYKVNGTSVSTAQIREIIEQVNTIMGCNGILLYLDEIQYLNKKQQQSLLEHIENGDITLIASTTENPYFYIYNAILSRSTVFEFKSVEKNEILNALKRAFDIMSNDMGVDIEIEESVLEYISSHCGGDVRKSINTVELCCLGSKILSDNKRIVTIELAKELTQKSNMKYDKDGDDHYDLLSALQKSIRGSDENASIFYLAKLLESGDLISPCRRLLVIASEDIGLAYPQAITIVKSCVDSALQLGLPEARIPLAQATILLATAPKSNSAYMAIDNAMYDIKQGKGNSFPRHLQNNHFDGDDVKNKGQGYKYPHDYKNHYVKAQYLPDDIKDRVYYNFSDNKFEQNAKLYKQKIIRECENNGGK